jgi:hypothetical protein
MLITPTIDKLHALASRVAAVSTSEASDHASRSRRLACSSTGRCRTVNRRPPATSGRPFQRRGHRGSDLRPPKLDWATVLGLAEVAVAHRTCWTGPTGVGKTFLACARPRRHPPG